MDGHATDKSVITDGWMERDHYYIPFNGLTLWQEIEQGKEDGTMHFLSMSSITKYSLN